MARPLPKAQGLNREFYDQLAGSARVASVWDVTTIPLREYAGELDAAKAAFEVASQPTRATDATTRNATVLATRVKEEEASEAVGREFVFPKDIKK